MIKKFSVKNFKNFKDEITIDFSNKRDYEFKQDLIKNGLVNKMLIYGKNNTGKSNLGAAIMDITCHLTDNQHENILYNYYMNGDSIESNVDFNYLFLLENQEIEYKYSKSPNRQLVFEEFIVNGKSIYKYNYKNNQFENLISEAQTIDMSKRNREMSALKFIYVNTMYWPENSPVKLMIEFVKNMLWFRSLKQNEFMGLMPNGENLSDFIINNRLTSHFQNFLSECGQEYHLQEMSEMGKKVLGVKYKNFTARFEAIASTGTLSLWLFFYWMNRTTDISFIYLDEFDAFYHFELSQYILRYINSKREIQSILTTHNTFLIDNDLLRPDCYFALKDGKIRSFADSTKKVIRQGHNLEKMMISGEFDE
ncbi:MAG TPA: AAA family ATPase [Bacillota bacterium]|nr:AAA family ATPase [Bacillota bacterium]HPF42260.1 AAA family ATPase [Bacillota bacterium]HPJ85717.1 AAA family ATPase [Bacillota bacterium]HPQ61646.1 AAA family ATPase [Bacillota bacterium]